LSIVWVKTFRETGAAFPSDLDARLVHDHAGLFRRLP